GVVLLVLLTDDVVGMAVGTGPFPVEVDTVEDTLGGTFSTGTIDLWQVSTQVQVDTGADEFLAGLGGERGVGEVPCPAPPTEGDVRAQVRVLLLECGELVEVAA